MQVYLILDEFVLGGEIEESSKKVRSIDTRQPRRLSAPYPESLMSNSAVALQVAQPLGHNRSNCLQQEPCS